MHALPLDRLMKVKLEIEIPPTHDEAPYAHTAMAGHLRALAEKLDGQTYTEGIVIPIRDGNGNEIGQYEVNHGV